MLPNPTSPLDFSSGTVRMDNLATCTSGYNRKIEVPLGRESYSLAKLVLSHPRCFCHLFQIVAPKTRAYIMCDDMTCVNFSMMLMMLLLTNMV